MKQREQLRHLMMQRGFAAGIDEADRLILSGRVKVAGKTVTQCGSEVSVDAVVELSEHSRYVSRGGLKLEGALEDFSFDPVKLCCIDVGASSGGFTDCLLQRGAASVAAVDVGYGQFDWRLRGDPRVTLFERTNIAKAEPDTLGAPFDLLVADLSFTSLARLAPVLAQLVDVGGSALALVKPQFELRKDLVKTGVIHRFDLHVLALRNVLESFGASGLAPQSLTFSPVKGPKGNIEFWIWAIKDAAPATIEAEETVERAHQAFV